MSVPEHKMPTYYSEQELLELNPNFIPKHIAIIPDGNRRWARKVKTEIDQGHREGADNLMDIVKAAKELGIKTLTFYIFSTENWKRPLHEVHSFMALLEKYLKDKIPMMIENGVRIGWIGKKDRLSSSLLKTLQTSLDATAECNKMDLVLAINYGGRDDIARACQKISEEVAAGKLESKSITEELIAQYIDTYPWGDPDLLIRASGEMRISNFLLWQLSYSEIYVTDSLWPDFTSQHLLQAVRQYQARDRRLGGS